MVTERVFEMPDVKLRHLRALADWARDIGLPAPTWRSLVDLIDPVRPWTDREFVEYVVTVANEECSHGIYFYWNEEEGWIEREYDEEGGRPPTMLG